MFALAIVIYLDYKVTLHAVLGKKCLSLLLICFYCLKVSLCCYVFSRLYSRGPSGSKANPKRLPYGKKLMNAMQGVFSTL